MDLHVKVCGSVFTATLISTKFKMALDPPREICLSSLQLRYIVPELQYLPSVELLNV